jgi:hypothetical protein
MFLKAHSCLLFFFIFPGIVFASSSETFVFGGYLNSRRYAENIDRVYAYQASLDPDRKVETVIGYYRRADTALSQGIRRWDAKEIDTAEKIMSHFSNQLDSLTPGTNVRFITTGHGFEPDDGPAIHRNATIGLDKLSQLFKKNQNKTVRLLSTQCYSGSMHQLAFENNNVCVSASTDRRTAHFNPADGTAEHQGAFLSASAQNGWDLDHNGRMSMYERHLSGLLADTQNYSRSDLSSNAYIDFITKSGAYSTTTSFNSPAVNTFARPEALYAINFYKEKFVNLNKCGTGPCASTESLAKSAGCMTDILGSLIDPKFPTPLEMQTLPTEIRKIYEGLFASNQIKALVSDEKTAEFVRNYSAALSEWNSFKSQNSQLIDENDSGTLLSGPRRNDPLVISFIKSLNTFEERFSELNKKPESRIFNLFKAVQSLNKIITFQKTATGSQKEKLLSLIQCEMGEF